MPPATKTKSKQKLTDGLVQALPVPLTGQAIFWDTHTQGLGVRITANGSKAYIAQGQCNGKTVRVTLARCNEIDVKEARKRCAAATLLMRDGTNPVDRKRQTRVASLTLQDVLEDYLANRRTKFGPLRPGTKKLMRRHIERNLTNWCNKSIASITHAMVATRFREISATAPVQANLVMISLQSLCNWARDSSIGTDGVPTVLPFNPVTTAFKQLVKWNVVTPRTKRVPTNKTGAVWHLLTQRLDSDHFRPVVNQTAALTLALLMVGSRFNELAKLRWEHVFFDAESPYLTFVTKTHRTLLIPLTVQLAALLRQQHDRKQPGNPFVFVGLTKRTHVKDIRGCLEHVSEAAGVPITPHDLRRSFVQAGATCKVEKYVIDLLSGHAPQDVTGIHYLESEDLRYLLPQAQQIADWLEGQGAIFAAQQAGANVVSLVA